MHKPPKAGQTRNSWRRARANTWKGAAAAALIAAATTIAACGGGTDNKAGGMLTIGNPIAATTMDPASGAQENYDYFNLAYDPLIVMAVDGSFKPGLATSWRYGPRNESFSIKLRPNVRFSDGERLDAAAVKTWIDHAMKLPGGRAPQYLATLQSIDLTGPLSLTLRFKAPTPLLERVLSQDGEIGMIGSPKAVKAKTLATNTAGAGPYVLDKARTVSGDHYTFIPNPLYWNKSAVHWQKVVIKKIASPTSALQALKTGQIQVAKDQPTESIAAAKAAGLKAVAPPTLIMGLAILDRDGTVAKPLGDVRVRQAINYAIDRDAVAKVIGLGYGRPTTQMAMPGDDSYDASLQGAYPYDPAKAKQLLTAAGYPNGFTVRTLASTSVGEDKFAQAIAGQLSKVGITLDLDVKADVGDYITRLGSRRYPTATLTWGRQPAILNYQSLWGPDATPFNPFKTTNGKLTSLTDRMAAASAESAPSIGRQIQQILVRDAWFAPVVSTPLVTLHTSAVTGVDATSQRNVEYTPEIAPAS